MVRFNDKPQIQNSQITSDDILPITDIADSNNDKKITLGQIKNFVNDGEEKANIDFTNTNMITDSIISAPNGIFEASNNNQAITVKSGLEIAFANGRDDATGRYAIVEHTTSQDITQSIVTLSNNLYELFLTNNNTILFIDTDDIYISEDEPQLEEGVSAYWYNLIDNYWKSTTNGGSTWSTANIASLGTIMVQNGVVVSSKPNQLLGIISFEVFKKMTEQEKRPGSLDICDIGMALYIDESKGLRRYLNGSIVDINENTQAFANKLKQIRNLYPGLFVTEQEWQQIANNSVVNQCGKFVFDDDANTIRLPKIVMPIQGLTDLSKLGELVDESLPNITGTHYVANNQNYNKQASGAFTATSIGINGNAGAAYGDYGSLINFDASRSSSTYQDGAHVQQEQIQYPYFIQIATGQETEADIINQIQLNNPVTIFESKWSDHILNNLSWLRSDTFSWRSGDVYVTAYNKLVEEYATGTEETEGSITFKQTDNGFKIADVTQEQAIMDKYNADGIAWYYILDTANRRFKLPRMKYKYWKNQSTLPVMGNGIALGFTNGTEYGGLRNSQALYPNTTSYGAPISTTSVANNQLTGTLGVTTDSTKSGIVADVSNAISELPMYLYFYVGETVQNAKLIDIGRTNEVLNNKVDTSSLQDVNIVVETYIDPDTPTNGYRIWSDGYCEQWGLADRGSNGQTIDITLILTYNSDKYIVLANPRATTDGKGLNINNQTTNSFQLESWNTSGLRYALWKTYGYLAEGEY